MKRQGSAGRFSLVLIASVLILLSTSCRTAPEPLPAPEITIDWPTFPAPRGIVEMDAGVASMPLDYWLLVTEYVISVREVRGLIRAAMGGPIILLEE